MVSFNKRLLLTFRINLNPSTNQDAASTDFNFVQRPEGGRRELAVLAHLAETPSQRSCSVLAGEQQPHCEHTHCSRGFLILYQGFPPPPIHHNAPAFPIRVLFCSFQGV